ncbi:hypothetical protein V6N11_033949 [Hibiscus sabdariffa]|uniref:Putative plant transposon protein domain-containing protein n=1 Tax=Hibiscus sabdariffa TaxID=183260 RepID=A0ABR2S1W3_9ROSI
MPTMLKGTMLQTYEAGGYPPIQQQSTPSSICQTTCRASVSSIRALEDVDYDIIKDQLCLPGTTWNITGKNPGTVSRPQLLPEVKLWNTFIKRNLMPTSHNQTVDRTRLVLINAIIIGFKFNVGDVIARELSEACQNDKGILAFPCIISALCCRAVVPSRLIEKYTKLRSDWTGKEYMRKMDLTDVVPLQTVMPTPPASHQSSTETPTPSPVDAQNDPPAANCWDIIRKK